jgi:hypothetical protein
MICVDTHDASGEMQGRRWLLKNCFISSSLNIIALIQIESGIGMCVCLFSMMQNQKLVALFDNLP